VPITSNNSALTPRKNTPAFQAALATLAQHERLREKWLLCPNRRIGHQWLETVARNGQPLVNLHLHTTTSLALQLAGPAFDNRQLLSPLGRVVLAARLLRQLDGEYLGSLHPSLALAERVAATLHDLRLSGIQPDDLQRGQFEVPAKGRDLIAMLEGYQRALTEKHLYDDADLFRRASQASPPPNVLVLIPADLDLHPLERRLLESLPKTQRAILPVDEPPAPEFTDAFTAVGETNEVREVLRRCLANGWPLDQVEVLHTDTETYVSRFYEIAEQLGVPVTFAEGLPVRYSRPGRALAAWLAWQANNFPQNTLVEMIRDGLLEDVPSHLAATLRVVPIGFQRSRYLPQLDARCDALARRLAQPSLDEHGEPCPEKHRQMEQSREGLFTLRETVSRLLALTDLPLLQAAAEFLQKHARCVNELDNYAREAMQECIAELAAWSPGDDNTLNIREWLLAWVAETRVRGEGPRPGHLYVSRWENGGHSGRPHTFLVGLDANRFPPALRQDPVLLDRERSALSSELNTAATQRERAWLRFGRLRARLRGTVTASYASQTLTDHAEQAAGPNLPPTTAIAATAPNKETAALSETEWWLWRLCVAGPVANATQWVGECFPWLRRGLEATAHRNSDRFTEFDGFVPEAGATDEIFSVHRLEMMGKCPLQYFFRYRLKLEKPDELELDSERWLPPVEFGKLLHDVFCRHLRDGVPLEKALEENIVQWKAIFPPPCEGVFRRDYRRLQRSLQMFAAEPREGTPKDFEVEIPPQTIRLSDGTTLQVQGRIDRVDETPHGLELWDYKTGSATYYKKKDPFQEGRSLQHALYTMLADRFYSRKVRRFVYFFPTEKGRGQTIAFTPAELIQGPQILSWLRQLIAHGAFCATNEEEDCGLCDYRIICRNPKTVTDNSHHKLCATGNEMLAPFRQLRPSQKP